MNHFIRKHSANACLLVVAGSLLFSAVTPALAVAWKAGVTGDWETASNWVGDTAPTNGDSVAVNSGAVLLNGPTILLGSFSITNATLTFTNWATSLRATNVMINADAIMRCAGPFTSSAMSNRVWIICTNFVLNTGGSINVDYKGFNFSSGPAPGYDTTLRGGGGGHGGKGGDGGGSPTLGGYPYDSLTAPALAGSGGGCGNTGYYGYFPGAGGGAVRIEADAATIHGTITANGQPCPDQFSGAGAGGSVYITCRTLSGANGVITANGGASASGYNQNGNGGEGAGGRIAVIYDAAEQAALPVPNITFRVAGGRTNARNIGDLGTLYFPDSRLFSADTINNFSGQMAWLDAWSADNVTLTNGWIRFANDGFSLTITNNLIVKGSTTRLDLGGDSYLVSYQAASGIGYPIVSNTPSRYVYNGGTSGVSLRVGKDLVLTNAASLFVFSCATNSTVGTNFGALVSVAGRAIITSPNSFLYAASHPANGGAPLFCAEELIITTQATFFASGMGYSMSNGPGRGVSSLRPGGGGHGGQGGKGNDGTSGGISYGSSNAPMSPGSPPGKYIGLTLAPGWGGGVARINASSVLLNGGTISANAGSGDAGAGGSIWITTRTFGGEGGTLSAYGGAARDDRFGGGGGGRIAVWRAFDVYQGTCQTYVYGGSNTVTGTPGTNGTVVWGDAPDLAINPTFVYALAALGAKSNCTITAWNPGLDTKDLYWSAVTTPAWLSLGTSNGVITAGQTNTIIATNDATSLGVGWHTGTVVFVATNATTSAYPLPPIVRTSVVVCAVYDGTLPALYFQPIIDSGDESATSAAATVTLSIPSADALTVDYSAIGGSATGGEDFTNTSGTLTINPGMLNSNIYFTIIDDLRDETNETLVIGLSNPSGATNGATTNFTYTIGDNDNAVWITAGGTNYWSEPTNWAGGFLPVAMNDVVITNARTFVLLTNSTVALNSLTLASTLVFSNWDTALNVGSLMVRSSGVVTCAGGFWSTNVPPDMTNRVWIIANSNVTIDAGGKIDADAKGYSGNLTTGPYLGQGPGGAGTANASGCGGGHGGRGGDGAGTSPQNIAGNRYDLTNAPWMPGSGGGAYSGNNGGHGGGAIWLEATGATLTLNGMITGNGQNAVYGGGSGGAIYLNCLRIVSTGGVISAKGGNTAVRSGMGGGGRVALYYDTATQSALPRPSIRFDVGPGSGLFNSSEIDGAPGEPGSLYLPDRYFLTNNIADINARVYGFNTWSVDNLTISNCWFELAEENSQLTVTNDIVVSSLGRLGANRIVCGGNMQVATGTVYLYSGYWKRLDKYGRVFHDWGTNSAPILTVGGDLTLSGSGYTSNALYVFAVDTNAANTNYGALVDICGTLLLTTNTGFIMYSEGTNGGSVAIQARHFIVDVGAVVDTSGRGFHGGDRAGSADPHLDGWGYGAGYTAPARAGGYGGTGGLANASSGQPYGSSSNWPFYPGSGGRAGVTGGYGGRGGGLISVNASDTIRIDGVLNADGENASGNPGGGGSGGGIYLFTRNFIGTNATINANGGNAVGLGGGGGGGRIAVWYVNGETNGVTAYVTGGIGASGLSNGTVGTIFWGVRVIRVPGAIFSFH